MTLDVGALLEQVRSLALAYPGARETASDGMTSFHVEGGTAFASFSDGTGAEGRVALLVRTTGEEERDMLVASDAERHYRPDDPDLSNWIAVRLDIGEVDWARIDDRIAASWELAAPRLFLEAGGR